MEGDETMLHSDADELEDKSEDNDMEDDGECGDYGLSTQLQSFKRVASLLAPSTAA